MKYFFVTPVWLRRWYPELTWSVDEQERVLYLTFDDGPVPEVTPDVLDILAEYRAKATFFCVGENIKKHSSVFRDILAQGHSVGNHTYHHVNGWKMKDDDYIGEIARCQEEMLKYISGNRLFRPPHGRIRKRQIRKIKTEFDVIMWSHLSGDFDQRVNLHRSGNALRKAGPGSVIVFHDSIKARRNLVELLPGFLKYFSDSGYTFNPIPNEIN